MRKARYFEHFGVVELQSTFYEPSSVALATKWRALAPVSASGHEYFGAFRPTEHVHLAWDQAKPVYVMCNNVYMLSDALRCSSAQVDAAVAVAELIDFNASAVQKADKQVGHRRIGFYFHVSAASVFSAGH